jgi:putative nucleotidyltransferase with HDIG domain
MQELAAGNRLLEKITTTIGELPASPAIVSAIMGITTNLNANIEELGKVLAADPALTAKVLKLSNSSFYGRSKSVSSLKEAILILGFYTLRSMVIATSTYSLYKKKGNDKSEQKLWDHSLACAMACRLVGNRMRHNQIEEIFIVGLLHDIGKMALGQKLADVYGELVKEVESEKRSFVEIEDAKLGFNHADVGLIMLNKWNFPGQLVTGVHNHHSPSLESSEPEDVPISAVVNFANYLAKRIGVGFNDFCEPNLSALPLAQRYELTDEVIEQLVTDLKTHYAEEKQLFEES